MTTLLLKCAVQPNATAPPCVLFHASEITRSSWQLLIQQMLPDIVTIPASSLKEVQSLIPSVEATLVIMEFHPSSSEHGIATLRSMVSLVGGHNIVLVCGPPAQVSARTAMQAGVSVMIGSNDSVDELERAIHAAQDHLPFMSSELASLLVRAVRPSNNALPMQSAAPHPLSGREEEVMNMLMSGMRPVQVATRLRLSLKTVSSHKRNALGKLGVANVLDAVRLCI